MKLSMIVEGHGEVSALPLLVDRLLRERLGIYGDTLLRPAHRMKRHQMVKEEHLTRAVELQARRVGTGGAILIVLDADEDCAANLAATLLRMARKQRSDRRIAVVVADHEYEAWLIAGARSLAGKRGLDAEATPPPSPDGIQDPKGWLEDRMAHGYSETRDQPAFTMLFDLGQAEASRSFRKLVKELRRLVGVSPEASD